MQKSYLMYFLILCLAFMANPKAKAGGPPTPINYGQSIDSYIVFVPNSVCPQDNYVFEAHLGEVVTITISEISGHTPHLYLNDGEVLIEGVASADGKTVTIENYTIANSQTPEIAIEANSAESFTETTYSVSVTLVTEVAVSSSIESFTVGTRPSHLVSDGSQIYVSNRDSHDISVLSLNGELLNTIPFNGSPSAMQWDGNRLWVADREGDSVYLFSNTGEQLAHYTVGAIPISMSYSDSNQIMWIALYEDSQVVALDMSGTELARINLPAQPSTVLSQPDSHSAWVALYADSSVSAKVVTVGTSSERDERLDYPVYPYANDIAYGNGHLFVVYSGSNVLTIIDTVQGSQQEFGIEGGYIIEVFWDGTYIWLTLDTNAITVLEYHPENQTIQQLRTFLLDSRPFGINYLEPFIWVSNRGTPESPGNSVTRINTLGVGLR